MARRPSQAPARGTMAGVPRSARAVCAIGGLGALGAATLLAMPAVAARQHADACAPVAKWKSVFPRAAVTDFAVRWPITYHSGTRNHWPGTCGGWLTTYTDYRGTDRTEEARAPTRDFALFPEGAAS